MDFIATHITETFQPAPDYVYLRFGGEAPIHGEPGQFAMVRGEFGTDPVLPRAFSLVETGDTGAILLRVVGKGTRRLADMRVSDVLHVLAPLGNVFRAPTGSHRPVLVAGGVGVAPLIFFAETLAASGTRPIFVYGGRTSTDILFQDRIAETSELMITTEDGSLGEKGLVTAPVARLLEGQRDVEMYTCGPEPMMAALFRIADASGATLQVSMEQSMACGMGTCKGCAVHGGGDQFEYVCSDGPVFDARQIFGGSR
jgi:dihydroorotate dehydrogenase electron transfer subunit